ncbi:MAG: alpha-1,2-fucosyltransferase [Selenomonadaceae bacterium]|nr:alpha-1,2-fucosyltransferase [Selenomonadaceae bacterium]MBQ9496558.1 alpha-1,2-fucosyltransferase [Selenomonadaceae bacterium]
MVVTYIMGGIGNQLYQYAAGRRLAHKLKTKLKLDVSFYERDNLRPYALNLFNVKENFATPEEISSLKKCIEPRADVFMPEVLNYPDNVFLYGYWQNEKYFADIADILRREFTLKNPLGAAAQYWKEKILAAENSVSLHVRLGDFVYSPRNANLHYFAIPSLDYYGECLEILKREYKNLTLFIFSDNLNWCKENFRFEFPTEFVEGDGLQDVEELYLMSICRHNVTSKSTFSRWGAWLNQNPDKKIFKPVSATEEIPPKPKKKSRDADKWISVPFKENLQSVVEMRPYFSLLLVLNNDADILVDSLGSILGQDFKFFELIIVDNASTDGSGKICRESAKVFDKITVIRLHDKIQNGAAWNIALNAAQGDYVMFLKGNDRLPSDALTSIYLTNEHIVADVVNSIAYLKEDARGGIDIFGKKFAAKIMSALQNMNGVFREKLDKSTLMKILSQDEKIFPIGTRVFSRKFLAENKIRFNEKIGDDAENLFAVEAMFQTEEIIFMSPIFYAAP